ncbi:MAG: hypothetical protein K2X93_18250 [Candidatus Obscuribacterales bacterium]|nr:hypothetical protein [Candidatus Obscuribacterales bacterium]
MKDRCLVLTSPDDLVADSQHLLIISLLRTLTVRLPRFTGQDRGNPQLARLETDKQWNSTV